MNVPFRLLSVYRTNRFLSPRLTQDAAHTASFLLPDGTELKKGLPASTALDAISYLFEADAGRSLAKPFAEPFVPLADATLDLCASFLWLKTRRDELRERLLATVDGGQPLPRDTVNATHQVFTLVQECFAAAQRVVSHLPADADADAKAHPLHAYARATATQVLLQCVSLTLNMLGHPASIKVDGRNIVFTAELDITPEQDGLADVPGWPTQAALDWWHDRDARLHHFDKWLDTIEDIAKRTDGILAEGARLH